MKEKSNKKYLIFPIAMLVITIITTFLGHHLESIYITLDKYDITGMTSIFMYVMLTLEIIILSFCIYKGKKGVQCGFDYSFSKFACVIFIILIIIPIVTFFIIRSEEEKVSVELDNQINETIEQVLKAKNKNNKIQEYFEIEEKDKFYDRKNEIKIEVEKYNSKIEPFLKLFVFNRYNYNIFYKNYLTMEERYYAIFSRASIINIMCLAFYLASSRDKKLNEMRNSRIK